MPLSRASHSLAVILNRRQSQSLENYRGLLPGDDRHRFIEADGPEKQQIVQSLQQQGELELESTESVRWYSVLGTLQRVFLTPLLRLFS